MNSFFHTGRSAVHAGRHYGALAAGIVLLAGCSSLLEVDNPNNVDAGALDVPAAAAAIVQGGENETAQALSSLNNAYSPATDETYWVGSRDDYRLLDTGGFEANTNEYVQAGYLPVMKARWLSGQAIEKIAKFRTDGDLLDLQLLTRAYLNGAVIYTAIADASDDVAISDRRTARPNLGEMGMVQLYDSALKWLDLAAPIATGDLRPAVIGMRARVRLAKGIWQKLNPPGTTPANPLVNDAQAGADAAAALALMTGDFRYEALTNDLNEGDGAGGGFGFEMNSRVEYTPSQDLAKIDPNSGKPEAIIAKDPVTGLVDAAAQKTIPRITDALNHPPITLVSAREMRLIVAEVALAAGNDAGFDAAINALRAMDGKAPYTGTGPTRVKLLEWERRINLIFQMRRLNDMYRFGTRDPNWGATSLAVRKPGCLFPIPNVERESNPLITSTPVCQ